MCSSLVVVACRGRYGNGWSWGERVLGVPLTQLDWFFGIMVLPWLIVGDFLLNSWSIGGCLLVKYWLIAAG